MLQELPDLRLARLSGEPQEWLAHRAVAGRVSAFRLAGVELSSDDRAAFWDLLDDLPALRDRMPAPLLTQLIAGCCAGLEALVEVAELRNDPSQVSELPLVQNWLDPVAE